VDVERALWKRQADESVLSQVLRKSLVSSFACLTTLSRSLWSTLSATAVWTWRSWCAATRGLRCLQSWRCASLDAASPFLRALTIAMRLRMSGDIQKRARGGDCAPRPRCRTRIGLGCDTRTRAPQRWPHIDAGVHAVQAAVSGHCSKGALTGAVSIMRAIAASSLRRRPQEGRNAAVKFARTHFRDLDASHVRPAGHRAQLSWESKPSCH
jgi:hypothetical protein